MDESTARRLEDMLSGVRTAKEMEQFMEQPKVTDGFQTFPDYFRSLPETKSASDSEIILRSGLERSYYYQIMKGRKNPRRDKVLRLCLGAGLTPRETTRARTFRRRPALPPGTAGISF